MTIDETIELKALTKVRDDLVKLREKAQEKLKKEQERNSKKFIKFKGYECYTHDEIDDVYRFDECTNSECDKAHDKLDNLLNTNWTGDTSTSIYIKILNKYLSSLNTEIYEMTKSEVNNNDNT
jgi:hypothetical protein